ncbi:DNA internalization-related competence protein ComEC/Rec2 [Paenibacillus sp. HJGM_3]|uniref:DNA internalization-related competence protein ComEC/Rec2 n=1 Tax=Paenibacillus sp. HJGM_3 TaxID=3379816 RepID=UPI00385885BB
MRNRPIVQAAVLWTAGYVWAEYAGVSWLGWRTGGIALLVWALVGMFKPPGSRYVSMALLFLLAACYYQGHDARNTSGIAYREAHGREVSVEGAIVSSVEVDGDRAAFTVRADHVTFGSGTTGASDATDATDATDARDARDANKLLRRPELLQVSVRLLERQDQDVAEGWGRGDRIRFAGTLKLPEPARNFGGFDYRRYLYWHHIHATVSVKGLGSVAATRSSDHSKWSPLTVMRWNDEARAFLGDRFDGLFDSVQAGYMKSLVLGITEDFDPDRYQQFSRLGLTHVLAISGLHVAVFVAGCMGLLRLLGLTREKMLVVTMALVPLYAALAGGSPSVVRAGLMAMIALYAARRGLLKDGLHLLSAVALLMLAWEPYYLFNVSFQLSFLVTAGLIVGVPRFSRLLPIRTPWLNSAISVTTVAQLISFPISIYYFNSLSLLSWLANMLLVPFISFVTLPLGSVALLVSLIWLPAGRGAAWLAEASNHVTFWLVDQGAAYRVTQTIWPTPPLLWIGAYFVALALIYKAFERAREGRGAWPLTAVLCGTLALLAYAYEPAAFKPASSQPGSVSFLDVGQGDAILIRTPQGRTMLIDGGGTLSFRKPGEEWKERSDPYEVGAKLLVPLLKKRGIHELDYVVVSHQDADHIGGLLAVLEQMPVKRLLFNDTWKGNESSRQLFETALEHGVELLGAGAGDQLGLDGATGLTVLAPPDAGAAGLSLVQEQNGASLVLLMEMFDTRFLFTGDIGAEQEMELMVLRESNASAHAASAAPAVVPPIDVLKIAHHGSKTSTSSDWLSYWRPIDAVISVGATNSYGHPNPQVLKRIQASGARLHRTDREGELVYRVSRRGVEFTSKLQE